MSDKIDEAALDRAVRIALTGAPYLTVTRERFASNGSVVKEFMILEDNVRDRQAEIVAEYHRQRARPGRPR